MGHGGQIRAVGLGENPVERDAPRHSAQVISSLEGDVAGERNQKAAIHEPSGVVERAAETVEDSAAIEALAALEENFLEGPPGFSAVDHDRELSFARDVELPDEHSLLDVAWGEVVVVVEANFADGQHFRMREKLAQPFEVSLLDPRRFVRMKSRGGVNPIVPLGERDCGS